MCCVTFLLVCQRRFLTLHGFFHELIHMVIVLLIFEGGIQVGGHLAGAESTILVLYLIRHLCMGGIALVGLILKSAILSLLTPDKHFHTGQIFVSLDAPGTLLKSPLPLYL